MIPKDEWLPQAERLAVGQTRRVKHNFERDCAMTVSNKHDRYWAYCQRCKDGGVHMKEYVRLDVQPVQRTRLRGLPDNVIRLIETDVAVQHRVWRFLATKGMDPSYIPLHHMWYCPTEHRLILKHNAPWGKAMGRALYENAQPKWLDYYPAAWYAPSAVLPVCPNVVLVEDVLSAYKVQHYMPNVLVVCSHGTAVRDELLVQLLEANSVIVFYDGDQAGYDGAHRVRTQLRGVGIPNVRVVDCDAGKDPKDLHAARIIELLT